MIRAAPAHLPATAVDVSHPPGREADLARQSRSISSPTSWPATPSGSWTGYPGSASDTERAHRRGITLSNQQYDGMSRLST